MQELITEVYRKGAMAEKKRKKRKWMKEPKIPRDVLTEAADMMRLWNKKGTLATIPKLQRWMREEKGINVMERRIRHYITKMGFKWGKTKQKGLLSECERVVEWKRRYLEKGVCRRAEGTERPTIYLDELYVHQNHASNFSWALHPEGKEVGTPVGKGQRLVLMHAGGAGGWVEGALSMWVVKKNKKTDDYHDNVNHSKFFAWFCNLCQLVTVPSKMRMDNAGYHKVKAVDPEEKLIFNGRSFSKLTKSQLQRYLTHHNIEWDENWKRPQLYNVTREHWDQAMPAIVEIAREFGHEIEFLPPYHSDLNPIENVWGIIKNHVAQHQTEFSMAEVERLTREGVAKVTAEMWKKCVLRAERIEMEMLLDDVAEHLQ
jgi:transposase